MRANLPMAPVMDPTSMACVDVLLGDGLGLEWLGGALLGLRVVSSMGVGVIQIVPAVLLVTESQENMANSFSPSTPAKTLVTQ